jgi:hypothetical protein
VAKLTEDEITGMIGDNWIKEAIGVVFKDGTLSAAELEALSLGIEERES